MRVEIAKRLHQVVGKFGSGRVVPVHNNAMLEGVNGQVERQRRLIQAAGWGGAVVLSTRWGLFIERGTGDVASSIVVRALHTW